MVRLALLMVLALACGNWPEAAPDPMDKYRCSVAAGPCAHVACLCRQAQVDGSRGAWDFYNCSGRLHVMFGELR